MHAEELYIVCLVVNGMKAWLPKTCTMYRESASCYKSCFVKATNTTMNRTVHNTSQGFWTQTADREKITAVCKS